MYEIGQKGVIEGKCHCCNAEDVLVKEFGKSPISDSIYPRLPALRWLCWFCAASYLSEEDKSNYTENLSNYDPVRYSRIETHKHINWVANQLAEEIRRVGASIINIEVMLNQPK